MCRKNIIFSEEKKDKDNDKWTIGHFDIWVMSLRWWNRRLWSKEVQYHCMQYVILISARIGGPISPLND